MAVTQSDVSQFEREGYISAISVLSISEACNLRQNPETVEAAQGTQRCALFRCRDKRR